MKTIIRAFVVVLALTGAVASTRIGLRLGARPSLGKTSACRSGWRQLRR